MVMSGGAEVGCYITAKVQAEGLAEKKEKQGPPSRTAALILKNLLAENQFDSDSVLALRTSYAKAQWSPLREIELAIRNDGSGLRRGQVDRFVRSMTFAVWQLASPQSRKKLADAEAFRVRYVSSIGSAIARAEGAVQRRGETQVHGNAQT